MPEERRPVPLAMKIGGVLACIAVLAVTAFAWWHLVPPTIPVDAPAEVVREKHPGVPATAYPRPPLPDEGYVGGQVCATCHAELAKSYQHHPMSRSLAAIQDAPVLEDYGQKNSFQAGNCTYQVERRDGQVIHHEILADVDGEKLYDQAVEIKYALGSGTRGRSYLIDRDGIFFMSPIGWYTGKSWDLSPGYAPDRHQHFSRRITDGCLQCHSGRVNSDRTRPDVFPAPAFRAPAINCENCHGPGKQHVDFRRLAEPHGKDPIVNPARLAPAEREAVCYQCHLQATERILRYGRGPYDFRPGQKMNDIWTIYLSGTGVQSENSTEVVTQVEQMQSSRCYQKSSGRFGCTSCHDPHDAPDRESRADFYQAKCLTCHADRGCVLPVAEQEKAPANGSCIHCHMPPLRAEVVPHTSQTDHRVLRKPVPHKAKPGDRSLVVFHEEGTQLPSVELARARGLVLIRMAEGSRNVPLAAEAEGLLRQFLAVAPDDEEVLEALGAACLVQMQPQAAEEYWRTILKKSPHHEHALFRLASLMHDSGRMQEARDLFAKFQEVNPNLPEALGRNAHVLGQLGQLDEAIPLAQRALELDPRLIPLYGWLAEVESRRGNQAASERYSILREKLLKRLQP